MLHSASECNDLICFDLKWEFTLDTPAVKSANFVLITISVGNCSRYQNIFDPEIAKCIKKRKCGKV